MSKTFQIYCSTAKIDPCGPFEILALLGDINFNQSDVISKSDYDTVEKELEKLEEKCEDLEKERDELIIELRQIEESYSSLMMNYKHLEAKFDSLSIGA